MLQCDPFGCRFTFRLGRVFFWLDYRSTFFHFFLFTLQVVEILLEVVLLEVRYLIFLNVHGSHLSLVDDVFLLSFLKIIDLLMDLVFFAVDCSLLVQGVCKLVVLFEIGEVFRRLYLEQL